MKIQSKEPGTCMFFKGLKYGDVFRYSTLNRHILYLRLAHGETAVVLTTGVVIDCHPDTLVERVEGQFIEED